MDYSDSVSAERPQPYTPQDRKERSPNNDGALILARKTFNSMEIAAGAMPVVGGYVGAVARVGLAFVEMLQVSDIFLILFQFNPHICFTADDG